MKALYQTNLQSRSQPVGLVWGHSFSMYAKFSGKLTFLIQGVRNQGVRNDGLSENFAYVLNE